MSFINTNPIFNNIKLPNIQFRSAPVRAGTTDFAYEPRQDSFSTNPLYDKFADKEAIIQAAKSNPQIMNILKENNIRLNPNTEVLQELKSGHLKDTRITAAKMYSALPPDLKKEVNLSDLQQAAMLHDYGKIFIPDNILNKSGKLTDEEKKIMELHSELGYELLKGNCNKNVLNMIKYHHQTPQKDGYPEITNGYSPDISSQIIAASDKYCALREKRSYKDALSREEALKIIQQDVDAGLISPEVYSALEKST